MCTCIYKCIRKPIFFMETILQNRKHTETKESLTVIKHIFPYVILNKIGSFLVPNSMCETREFRKIHLLYKHKLCDVCDVERILESMTDKMPITDVFFLTNPTVDCVKKSIVEAKLIKKEIERIMDVVQNTLLHYNSSKELLFIQRIKSKLSIRQLYLAIYYFTNHDFNSLSDFRIKSRDNIWLLNVLVSLVNTSPRLKNIERKISCVNQSVLYGIYLSLL